MNFDHLFDFEFHESFNEDNYHKVVCKYGLLPEDYISFLKKYNKITTKLDINTIHVEGDDCRISVFLGCKGILEENQFNDPEDFPDQLLKIGVDAFGDCLCISIKGESKGKIYWFTPFDPPEKDPVENVIESYGNLYPIFNSFTELMEYLEKDYEKQ